MHINQMIWHGENIGTIWEISHECCIMKRVIYKDVTAGERFDFFWTLLIVLYFLRKLSQ